MAVSDDARRHGITARAGVHAGEVDIGAGQIGGSTVRVAHRLCSMAAGAQVLTTQRVVDLVAAAELRFDHVGEHHVVGVTGRWAAFEVLPAPRQLAPDHARGVPGAGGTVDLADLSPREREVLAALATGASNADVGAELFMSEATVKAHVSHLLVKLDCANRVQLAIVAHVAGLGAGRGRGRAGARPLTSTDGPPSTPAADIRRRPPSSGRSRRRSR
jgi:DNA-binding CsgD family transcriptional regulator